MSDKVSSQVYRFRERLNDAVNTIAELDRTIQRMVKFDVPKLPFQYGDKLRRIAGDVLAVHADISDLRLAAAVGKAEPCEDIPPREREPESGPKRARRIPTPPKPKPDHPWIKSAAASLANHLERQRAKADGIKPQKRQKTLYDIELEGDS